MAETHSSPTLTLVETVPVSAIVIYKTLADALTENHTLQILRSTLSHSFTAVLLAISFFGLYQLASITSATSNRPSPAPAAVVSAPAVAEIKPTKLAASPPVSMSIPAINLNSSFVPVGQNTDGSMEVPGPEVVGWYTKAPTPGEIGPAIFVGHVDDAVIGEAIFYHIDKLQPGDKIHVTREDGKVVTFAVENSASYEQDNFPTEAVYGNIDYPGLRLITCDGDFNYLTRSYSHNLVVYAKAIEL